MTEKPSLEVLFIFSPHIDRYAEDSNKIVNAFDPQYLFVEHAEMDERGEESRHFQEFLDATPGAVLGNGYDGVTVKSALERGILVIPEQRIDDQDLDHICREAKDKYPELSLFEFFTEDFTKGKLVEMVHSFYKDVDLIALTSMYRERTIAGQLLRGKYLDLLSENSHSAEDGQVRVACLMGRSHTPLYAEFNSLHQAVEATRAGLPFDTVNSHEAICRKGEIYVSDDFNSILVTQPINAFEETEEVAEIHKKRLKWDAKIPLNSQKYVPIT